MKGPSLTLGIEEEYQIIDPVTRELRSYITEILEEDHVRLGEVKPELHQSMVEIGSKVCQTPAELRERAVSHYKALSQLGVLRDAEEPNLKDPQLSFQLAHAVPDLNFLSVLLRGRSEAGRLTELNEYLSQYIPRQQAIERVKALALRSERVG